MIHRTQEETLSPLLVTMDTSQEQPCSWRNAGASRRESSPRARREMMPRLRLEPQVCGASRPPCSNLTCRRQQLVDGKQMVPGGCQAGPQNHSVGLFPRATGRLALSVGQIIRLDTTFPEATGWFPRGHLAPPCPHSLHRGRIPPQLQGPLLVGRVGSAQSCFRPHRRAGTAPTWPGATRCSSLSCSHRAVCCTISSFSPLLCLQGPGPVGLSLSPSPFSLAEPSALGSQVGGFGSPLGHSEQFLDAFTFCEDD